MRPLRLLLWFMLPLPHFEPLNLQPCGWILTHVQAGLIYTCIVIQISTGGINEWHRGSHIWLLQMHYFWHCTQLLDRSERQPWQKKNIDNKTYIFTTVCTLKTSNVVAGVLLGSGHGLVIFRLGERRDAVEAVWLLRINTLQSEIWNVTSNPKHYFATNSHNIFMDGEATS